MAMATILMLVCATAIGFLDKLQVEGCERNLSDFSLTPGPSPSTDGEGPPKCLEAEERN